MIQGSLSNPYYPAIYYEDQSSYFELGHFWLLLRKVMTFLEDLRDQIGWDHGRVGVPGGAVLPLVPLVLLQAANHEDEGRGHGDVVHQQIGVARGGNWEGNR